MRSIRSIRVRDEPKECLCWRLVFLKFRVFTFQLPIYSGSKRGLGLQGSGLKNAGSRAPGLQDGNFGAPGLHHSTPGLNLARISISVGAPSRESFGLRTPQKKFRSSRTPKALPLGPCLLYWAKPLTHWPTSLRSYMLLDCTLERFSFECRK